MSNTDLHWDKASDFRWHLWRGDVLVAAVIKRGERWYVDLVDGLICGQEGAATADAAMETAKSIAAIVDAAMKRLRGGQ